MKIVTLMLSFLLVFANTIFAQSQNDASITVTGKSVIKVVPDEVTVSFAIESFNKDLSEAKADNDEKSRKVLAFCKSVIKDSRDIQTSQISLHQVRGQYPNNNEIRGYSIEKSITIRLDDITLLDKVLDGAVEKGVNYISGIQYGSSQIIELRNEARLKAVDEAKTKASAIAGRLDVKLGKPLNIVADPVTYERPRILANINEEYGSAGGIQADEFAPGQISISAEVVIEFALE